MPKHAGIDERAKKGDRKNIANGKTDFWAVKTLIKLKSRRELFLLYWFDDCFWDGYRVGLVFVEVVCCQKIKFLVDALELDLI